MKKNFVRSLTLGTLSLALNATAPAAEDLYKVAIDFPNPPGLTQSFTGAQLPLPKLKKHINPMCVIVTNF